MSKISRSASLHRSFLSHLVVLVWLMVGMVDVRLMMTRRGEPRPDQQNSCRIKRRDDANTTKLSINLLLCTMMLSVAANTLWRSSAARTMVARTASLASSQQFAFFSAGSHDDFAPKRKVVAGEDAALDMIKVGFCGS
jgi:hypothetical protein